MNRVKIEALRWFSTNDALPNPVVTAKAGDIVEVTELTAKMLIKAKLAKKYHEKIPKEREEKIDG